MVCGSSRFIVQYEKDAKIKEESIVAQTPAEARKKLRNKCGSLVNILWVKDVHKN